MACCTRHRHRSFNRLQVRNSFEFLLQKSELNHFRYEFPVRDWIVINDDAKVFECASKEEDTVSRQRHRRPIKYKIIVHTGDQSHAGTDANVSIILYSNLGDTGFRQLKQ